jgi:AcrR family transcriptional regulator
VLRRTQETDPAELPLSGDRVERIIEAAQAAFLAHGFNGATTDMIQAAAAVSKSTLYRYFPTKELLFEAAMEAASRDFLQHVGQIYEAETDVATFLAAFGFEFLQELLKPRALDIVRLMVMESPRFPTLGKHFYLTGPKPTADLVERFLAQAAARGEIELENPAVAAEHFIGMIRGDIYLRCLLGVSKPPSTAQMRRYVALTVEAFLDGCRRG